MCELLCCVGWSIGCLCVCFCGKIVGIAMYRVGGMYIGCIVGYALFKGAFVSSHLSIYHIGI